MRVNTACVIQGKPIVKVRNHFRESNNPHVSDNVLNNSQVFVHFIYSVYSIAAI